ncbi:hypothetical protein G3573_16105, partial [Caulobacter sp. 17J65-9]|nr:hypothetical protein [Caulobacter sp. 17J65-9]
MTLDPATDVRLPSLAVLGTVDRAGRTTAAARLVRGLKRAGLSVGAIRLNGRRSGHGYWSMVDAGASPILDVGDQGARLRGPRLGEAAAVLLDRLAMGRTDVAVVELERELFDAGALKTLASEALSARLVGVLLTAPDPSAAGYATGWLRRWGVPVVAVSGAGDRASDHAARDGAAVGRACA